MNRTLLGGRGIFLILATGLVLCADSRAACTVTCPANITVGNDPDQCGAVVNYPAPTSSGSCSTITCSPASGSFYPVGVTTVTCTEAGGSICTHTITVQDTQPPTIHCPASIVVSNEPNQCGAVVYYGAISASDNCVAPSITASIPSGSFFPVGTTTVTCTAFDAVSNSATCSFTVTVKDVQPPTIACPPDQTIHFPRAKTLAIGVSASDNCPGVTLQTEVPPDSLFPVGDTLVTALATDHAGNTAYCGFHVRIVPPRRNDFDGDLTSDLGVIDPSSFTWYIRESAGGVRVQQFGFAGVVPVPGDYDGDSTWDIAVFHPASGNWYVLASSNGFSITQFGFAGAIPVAADYDGDGRTDIAVYHPQTGIWYLLRSTLGFTTKQFGYFAARPVPQDYDCDGRADIAVYDADQATWYMDRSAAGFQKILYGFSGATGLPADFDGDGCADVAVFHSSTGNWYLRKSASGFQVVPFGAGWTPVPADYDGDGRTDLGVFQPATGQWMLLQSLNGYAVLPFGFPGVLPIPTFP